jgi:hypothetical protein
MLRLNFPGFLFLAGPNDRPYDNHTPYAEALVVRHVPERSQLGTGFLVEVRRPALHSPARQIWDKEIAAAESLHYEMELEAWNLVMVNVVVDEEQQVVQRQVESVRNIFASEPTTPEREEYQPYYSHLQRRLYMQDLAVGRGFLPAHMETREACVRGIPQIDLVIDDDSLWQLILCPLPFRLRRDFIEYLELTLLGLVIIGGNRITHYRAGLLSESDITELLARTGLCYLFNPKIRWIYCSSPTHDGMSTFSSWLSHLGTEVVRRYNYANPDADTRLANPLVVHGHHMEAEIRAFVYIISHGTLEVPENPWRPMVWSRPLSVCEWALKIMKYRDFDLDDDDAEVLFRLRKKFEEKPRYKDLRSFVLGEFKLERVEDFTEADNMLLADGSPFVFGKVLAQRSCEI